MFQNVPEMAACPASPGCAPSSSWSASSCFGPVEGREQVAAPPEGTPLRSWGLQGLVTVPPPPDPQLLPRRHCLCRLPELLHVSELLGAGYLSP